MTNGFQVPSLILNVQYSGDSENDWSRVCIPLSQIAKIEEFFTWSQDKKDNAQKGQRVYTVQGDVYEIKESHWIYTANLDDAKDKIEYADFLSSSYSMGDDEAILIQESKLWKD